MLNFFALTIFIFVASVAPYASARGAALAFAQNPEEREISTNPIYEEKIHRQESPSFFIKTTVQDLTFPHHLVMKPQTVLVTILKPPLA